MRTEHRQPSEDIKTGEIIELHPFSWKPNEKHKLKQIREKTMVYPIHRAFFFFLGLFCFSFLKRALSNHNCCHIYKC